MIDRLRRQDRRAVCAHTVGAEVTELIQAMSSAQARKPPRSSSGRCLPAPDPVGDARGMLDDGKMSTCDASRDGRPSVPARRDMARGKVRQRDFALRPFPRPARSQQDQQRSANRLDQQVVGPLSLTAISTLDEGRSGQDDRGFARQAGTGQMRAAPAPAQRFPDAPGSPDLPAPACFAPVKLASTISPPPVAASWAVAGATGRLDHEGETPRRGRRRRAGGEHNQRKGCSRVRPWRPSPGGSQGRA